MRKKIENRRLWTEEEKQFMRDNAPLSVAEMAEILGRTEDSVSRGKVKYCVTRLNFETPKGRKWRVVAEFPSYEVSDHGEVRNIKRGNILKPRIDKNGYYTISFKIKEKTVNRTVHRMVAKAFIQNPENLPEVNHLDGEKLDNRKSNLEWATESENMQHAHDTGLIKMPTGDLHWTRRHGVKEFLGKRKKQA